MAYLRGERQQSELFPARLEEYVGSEDPVRVYDAFVNQLDFKELGIVLDEDQIGPPEFDPQAMVKLLVYGYAYGIRSSRKLERALYHNVSFMWLMGGIKPDHKTIARFRRDHRDALQGILKQCVRLCMELGLIEGNTLFVDGTKIRANAGMRESWSAERCQRVLEKTDAHIERILKECDAVDASEINESSLVNHPELKDAVALKAKVEAISAALKQSGKPTWNTTDPECRHMQGRQGSHAAYNVQMVVDDKNGFIVHGDAVNEVNDRRQLDHQITQANQTLGQSCKTVCADAGYDNNPAWKNLEDRGIEVVTKLNGQGISGTFTKDKFQYDARHDCYRCPMGETLTYRFVSKLLKHRIYRITDAKICRACPKKTACTRRYQGREISRAPLEEIRPVVQARYESQKGQRLYARRQGKVEHPFGHIKRNLGVQYFLLRGLSGARAETALFATCFNMARMMTIFGVGGLMPRFT